MIAYALDEALAIRLNLARSGKHRSAPPAGERFADDRDYQDDDWKGPVEVLYPEAA